MYTVTICHALIPAGIHHIYLGGISMKYVYPAIFTPEEDGGYSVLFTDFESCYTCGDTLQYRKRFSSKAVKKTLTIPDWMNL